MGAGTIRILWNLQTIESLILLGKQASRITVAEEGNNAIEEGSNTTDFSEANGNSGHAHC